jgi:cobalt-precorrin 5A hydrolase
MKFDSVGSASTDKTLTTGCVVAGIGLRQQALADEILALLDATLAEAGLQRDDLAALATLEDKASHSGLRAVSALLDIPLLALSQLALLQPVPNPSRRVASYLGLPSIAEAAALAFGPLLVEKRRSANVTCALSQMLPAYVTDMPNASSTASTLSTSGAGA